MRKIRVLIVDDSVVVRRILINNLSLDPELEVVGFASNGRLALSKISQVNPDLVTLDLMMPEMDGVETLAEIRKTYPMLPVIMVSAINLLDAAHTLDALALGANDYVTKPFNVDRATAERLLREELIPKIKALCSIRPSSGPVLETPLFKPTSTMGSSGARRPLDEECLEAVVIGASTGGPNALAEVLPQLSAEIPVPILIVQHMPPLFTKLLAERLSSKCHFPVHEATNGEPVSPGQAWLAPENACRPSVDVLFRSAAEIYGAKVLAVVMTGMGVDGLRGCHAIREAGGQILVQDEATSVVWGMSGAVARAGLADKILPLDVIAKEIMMRIRKNRAITHL